MSGQQSLKRKSDSDLQNVPSSKKHTDPQSLSHSNAVEEEINENLNEQEDEKCEDVDSEGFEYSEVEEDEFSDNDNNDTVDLSNDHYLSFSDNEITEERVVSPVNELSTTSKKDSQQQKVKRKRKKKNPNMRRNIRNVLAEKQLDSATQKLREKEIDRLKRLGMYATSPVTSPTSVIFHPPPSSTKSQKKNSSSSQPTKDVICLSSSDDEQAGPSRAPVPAKNNEVFVLSSDSDEGAMEEENLADHHSDLGECFESVFPKA